MQSLIVRRRKREKREKEREREREREIKNKKETRSADSNAAYRYTKMEEKDCARISRPWKRSGS